VAAIVAALAFRLPASVRNAGCALAAIVACYLLIVHLGSERLRRSWPKELAIGLVFGAGSSIATWSSGFALRRAWPEIALFAALCTLNCAGADYWEWRSDRLLLRYPHRLTRCLGRHFYYACFIVFVLAWIPQSGALNPVAFAVALSSMLLMLMAAVQESLSPSLGRLLADAALLTPLLFLAR
jgi:hypothetical protein